MKKLIAGNWKMNGAQSSLCEVERLRELCAPDHFVAADIVICPPATLLITLAGRISAVGIEFGGQDCHTQQAGAHTGDISAQMLKDAGAGYVITGHSERRADHGEDNDVVKAKASAAQAVGLIPIICVGETEAERQKGAALEVVTRQLAGSLPADGGYVVAYEPVWAIGTGLVPTNEDIAQMHQTIRNLVGAGPRILYGGSVKPSNARDILAIPNVDGALVGGASLKATDFFAIIEASQSL